MRRLTENEVIFRSVNQDAQKAVSKTLGNEMTLRFYCECSSITCKKRFKLSVKEYKRIHENDHRFVILPGHEISRIEKIIKEEGAYTIVEKYGDPPSNEAVETALSKLII